jgi:hypothetical protein
MMLSKEKCIEAISAWQTIKTRYSEIKKVVNPLAVFNFNSKECSWLNEHNSNVYFHAYAGINNKKLILIIVPINDKGKEVNLSSYVTSNLSPLRDDIDLVEKVFIKKVKKVTLTKNLQIKSHRDETQLPIENEPLISNTQSIYKIQLWQNKCLDWFYCESEEYKGYRIFNSFRVPLADLAKNIPTVSKIVCFMGLKTSTIYNRLVPVLIFVAIDGVTRSAEFINSNDQTIVGNAADFDSPCPPFCKDESSFTMLN